MTGIITGFVSMEDDWWSERAARTCASWSDVSRPLVVPRLLPRCTPRADARSWLRDAALSAEGIWMNVSPSNGQWMSLDTSMEKWSTGAAESADNATRQDRCPTNGAAWGHSCPYDDWLKAGTERNSARASIDGARRQHRDNRCEKKSKGFEFHENLNVWGLSFELRITEILTYTL